jgi:hypothetical protein
LRKEPKKTLLGCPGRVLPSLDIIKVKKAKGEEKPEEELMGKRKSSPRLATTSHERMLLNLSMNQI